MVYILFNEKQEQISDTNEISPLGIDFNIGHLLLLLPSDLLIDPQLQESEKFQLSSSWNIFQEALAQTSDREAIYLIDKALKQLGTVEVLLPEENQRLDEYFHVKHITTPDKAKILLASILNSYKEFLKCQFNTSHPKTMDRFELWVKLHWLFFVMNQALIIALDSLEKALNSQDMRQAEVALKLATILMDASCESLKLPSTLITRLQYNTSIRNLMPLGLSGQEALDHVYFRKLSRRVQLLSDSLSDTLTPAIWNGFRDYYVAAKLTYDAHVYVCARFIGSEEPSLRQKALNKQKPELRKISAADILLQMKQKAEQQVEQTASKCPLKTGLNVKRQLTNKFTEMMKQLFLTLNLPYPMRRTKSVKVVKQAFQEYANFIGQVFDLNS